MRRAVFLVFGVCEFAVAAALALLGWQLPSSSEVDQSFARAERVTQRTGTQVDLLRRQLHDLRRPELQQLANRLETQTRSVTSMLRAQSIDFQTVATLSDSLAEVARGLEGLTETLDPEGIGKLGEGLGATASFLDEKVAPAAGKAADQLDASTKALQTDALRLKNLLREAPLDLRAAREIHDSLGRFCDGLEVMKASLKLQRLDTMQEGFRGLESALNTGAGQVERLASYYYPVVTFTKALKPMIEQRPFWPEGGQIADGMRKAALGATAAGKEMETLAAELPKVQTSLDESRKVAEKTREALGLALKQQDQIEPLLKNVPEHAARLAEELPKLGEDLARILRDTQRLKEVAVALREAQKGIETTVARWPELHTTLSGSAKALKTLQRQLRMVVDQRAEYEAALQQSVVLADAFATMLPLFTLQLEGQLREQEQALDELGQGLDEVTAALPAYADTASRIVWTTRWLLGLVAFIIALHGGYLVLSARLGRAFSM